MQVVKSIIWPQTQLPTSSRNQSVRVAAGLLTGDWSVLERMPRHLESMSSVMPCCLMKTVDHQIDKPIKQYEEFSTEEEVLSSIRNACSSLVPGRVVEEPIGKYYYIVMPKAAGDLVVLKEVIEKSEF